MGTDVLEISITCSRHPWQWSALQQFSLGQAIITCQSQLLPGGPQLTITWGSYPQHRLFYELPDESSVSDIWSFYTDLWSKARSPGQQQAGCCGFPKGKRILDHLLPFSGGSPHLPAHPRMLVAAWSGSVFGATTQKVRGGECGCPTAPNRWHRELCPSLWQQTPGPIVLRALRK